MSKFLSDFVVDAVGLVKRFGPVTALDGLDLRIRRGEVHGFLGPNGAGKSTTIRALLGQIRLDAGTATVLGMGCWARAVEAHARLAYVPGDTALWPALTGGECIDMLGGLQGSMVPSRRAELIERFELDPTRRWRTYSKGNRQKVVLVAALACDVELYILDEPTSGLDPLMEAVFQQVVADRAAEGASVLLSSHILTEVEALCSRVTVVRSGRSVFCGSLAELRADAATAVDAVTTAPMSALEHLPGISDWRVVREPRGVRTSLLVQDAALPRVLMELAAATPLQVTLRPPTLDQLFLEQYSSAAGQR